MNKTSLTERKLQALQAQQNNTKVEQKDIKKETGKLDINKITTGNGTPVKVEGIVVKPENKVENKPEVKSETKAETKAEVKNEIKNEVKNEIKEVKEVKNEVKQENKNEVKNVVDVNKDVEEVGKEDKKEEVVNPVVEDVKSQPVADDKAKEDKPVEEAKTTRGRKQANNTTPPKEENSETPKYQRMTRLEKGRKDKTIKNLYKNRAKLRFDLAIQRNEVWTSDQKSMLIHSILYGFPIPPVMVQKDSTGDNIWFLDGKQRLTTILGYLSDEWALSKKTPDVFGLKIANKKFSELTEDVREMIYDETITLIEIEHITDEERDEMFIRWNSGTGLSKIELTRAMHTALIEQVNEISKLEFFADSIALTDKGRNRFLDQEIILQIAMLLDDGKNQIKGFGSKEVKEYVLRLKEVDKVLSDDIMKQFKDISHYVAMAVHDFEYAERTKSLKKIHIPIIFYTAIKAMQEKVKFSDFGVFVKDFLITNYKVDSDYGEACQKGSSKKEAVLTRLNEMDLHLGEYIETLKAKNRIKN